MTNAAQQTASSETESRPHPMSNGIDARAQGPSRWSTDEAETDAHDVPDASDSSDAPDAVIADQSGRPLGRRALETRKRILEATVQLLAEKSMRDLRVIDIARIIGSSPATFYQYFKDVEDVVLYLASEINDSTPEMIDLIHGDWEGHDGLERGRALVNLVVEHWEPYISILRVRNNAAEEGNPAFAEVRIKSMLPILTAFGDVIRASHERAHPEIVGDDESTEGRIHPISGAMVLLSLLEGMTTHHRRFEKRFSVQGEGREQLVETLAALMQSVLTSPR